MPDYITDNGLLSQLNASPTASKNPSEFAQMYGAAAERAGAQLKVNPKALLAQWGLETGWGKSVIPGTNNLGNIKDFTGGGVSATDNQNGSQDKYRAFETPEAFADHYVGLVGRKYKKVIDAGDDIGKFTAGLAGYAEDPRYAEKLQAAYRTINGATNPVLRAVNKITGAIMPSANAAEPRQYVQDPALLSTLGDSQPGSTSKQPASGGRQYINDPSLLQQLDGKKKEVSLLGQVRAGAAGINKGFFSDLLGLPVDTAANVVDLVKAVPGTIATAFGRPDLAPEINSDRSGIVGSSDWIAKKINNVGLGGAINNPNPQDTTSRVLYSGGRVGGASIVPSPRVAMSGLNQLANIGRGVTAGVTGGAVGEVAPEYAGVAAMMPALAGKSAASVFNRALVGGDPGRKAMAQRLQDFKAAGVDEPSLGLATGNKLTMGIENLLAQTPGSSRFFERSRENMLTGIQGKTNELAGAISPVRGPVEAGSAIQRDLKGPFKDRISNTYESLNNKVEQAVSPNALIPVNESISKANFLTTPIPGAEATSSNFLNSRIRKMGNDLNADAGGKLAQTTNSLVLGPDGKPATQTTTPATAPQGVPFSAVKDLRTKIGKEAASNAIMGTPEQAEFKQMYGALSRDMKSGVALADLQTGSKGTQALERANAYYSRAMERAGVVEPMANRTTPEGTYNALAGSLNNGPTTYEKLRGVISPEARRKVAATVVEDMGRATPGQQNAEGTQWSTKTFITNYSKMDQDARSALFKRFPGGAQYERNLGDIAKAADMINQGAKVWANPSGTGAALSNKATFYALTAGAYFQPLYAAGTATGLVLGNAASRLMTNPTFVNWLAKAPQIKPADAQSFSQRLIESAKLSMDKQLQKDVEQYLSSVKSSG